MFDLLAYLDTISVTFEGHVHLIFCSRRMKKMLLKGSVRPQVSAFVLY